FWTALPAALAARRLGLPFVYEVRSFWSVTREAEEPGFRRLPQARRDDLLEQLTLALADRVLALNSAMAGQLAEFGVDPARVRIVPNCVDTDRFCPGPRDPALTERYGIAPEDIAIGYIGAMREYEGLDLLIEAAGGLAPDYPRLKLLIFGADPALAQTPGTVEHALAARIEASGCAAIRLLPLVPPDIVPALYRSFDICAYPRRGFEVTELVPPLKPLEAMASGRPVVISDVGGMRDLVTHERTGLVCAKDDAKSLAAMLTRLLEDRELRERLGEAGRRFVSSERSWSDAAATVEGVYAGLGGAERYTGERSPAELLDALFGAGAER
ncbi:MAG: glycosyltransferase family 4 protein, partial [Sphingomonadales bacterium]|nr:glycosyltransferase family 4 protein [Sphingomonadales bacterium]